MGDLLATAGAGRDENRLRGSGAHSGQDAELADAERHVVMFGLVAEGAGHAAAGRLEGLDLEAGDELQRGDARAQRVESLLVAMAVQQRLARRRLDLELPAAGGAFGRDEFLEEPRLLGERRAGGPEARRAA